MPTPAPVIGATLARMRSTSAKARVTSAKYEPFRPERTAHAPMQGPAHPPPPTAAHDRGQAMAPKPVRRMAETEAPVPKKAPCPNEFCPPKPADQFQALPSHPNNKPDRK